MWHVLASSLPENQLTTTALRRVRDTDASSKVNFTIKYLPYQLYPEATQEGEDKYEWYKKSRYGDSEEKMKMYTTCKPALLRNSSDACH